MDMRKKIIENILVVPNPTNKRISKMEKVVFPPIHNTLR
jgi:hypothetical protein